MTAPSKTSYRIIWRPKAQVDLNHIIDYIAQDNPAKAKQFGQMLRDKTLPLMQHPNLGRTGRPGLPAFVREWVVYPNYIIFYRVLNKARTVEILRVKHAAQHLP